MFGRLWTIDCLLTSILVICLYFKCRWSYYWKYSTPSPSFKMCVTKICNSFIYDQGHCPQPRKNNRMSHLCHISGSCNRDQSFAGFQGFSVFVALDLCSVKCTRGGNFWDDRAQLVMSKDLALWYFKTISWADLSVICEDTTLPWRFSGTFWISYEVVIWMMQYYNSAGIYVVVLSVMFVLMWELKLIEEFTVEQMTSW